MLHQIENLVMMFEGGQISRRQLAKALLIASAVPLARASSAELAAQQASGAKPAEPVFRGRIINHVTLSVTDIERSREFYQGLLGATVLLDGSSYKTPWYDLQIGDSFVAVSAGKQPGIGHFAIGVDPWVSSDEALAKVQKRYPASKPTVGQNPLSKAKEVRSVMLRDPDGIAVQIGHVKYQL